MFAPQDNTVALEKVFLRYFENEKGERTPHYDAVRYWLDTGRKVVAHIEDAEGKEIKTDFIEKIRISIPKAYIYCGKTRYELLRKTKFDRVPKDPHFVIERNDGDYRGDFKTLDEAKALLESGRTVRGKFIEDGCIVYTGPIKAVYLDAKMFETQAGVKYFVAK